MNFRILQQDMTETANSPENPTIAMILEEDKRFRNMGPWWGVGFATLMWLAVFVPGHMFGNTLEYVFIFLLTSFGWALVWSNRIPRLAGGFSTLSILGLLTVVTLLYTGTYAYRITVDNINTGGRDMIEVVRFLVYGAIFLSIITCLNNNNVKRFEKIISITYYFSISVALLYFVNVPFFSNVFQNVIYADTKTVLQWGGWMRLSVPFENPNYLGFFAVLTFCYFLFFSRLTAPKVLVVPCVIFLTGSRSAWLVFAGVLVIYYFHTFYSAAASGRVRKLAIATATGLVVIALAIYFWDFIVAGNRVSMLMRALESGSLLNDSNAQGRVAMAQRAFDFFAESPLTGTGPAKYETMDVVDNQFFRWLLRMGLLGSVIIIGILVGIFVTQFRNARGTRHKIGLITFWGATAAYCMTGSFLSNFRMAMIFALLIGCISIKIREGNPRSSAGYA